MPLPECCAQVLGERFKPAAGLLGEFAGRFGCFSRLEHVPQRLGEHLDLRGPQREAMIGDAAGVVQRALDGVEPIHLELVRCRVLRPHPAALAVIVGVTQRAGTGEQEVRVQRQDHIRLAEVVVRVDVLVESELRPFQHGRAAGRLILIPFRFREMVLVEQFRHLGVQRRRRDVLSQNAQAGALPGFQLVQSAAKGRQRLVPGPRPAAIRQGLRTVRIVQAEDGRLNEQVGGAEAGRMTGIALDLRRTALVALDENAGGHAPPAAWPWRSTAACPAPSIPAAERRA